jgi:hypothetical protein
MITEKEYQDAKIAQENAQKIINQYWKEQNDAFEKRLKENPIFKENELIFSATARCPCGAGLAYPKNCTPHHYWDCAAILMGNDDKSVTHTDQKPFAFWKVKSESKDFTTRPSSK